MFFKHLERRERVLGEKYNEGLRREKEGGLGRCPKRPLVFAPEGRMKLVYNTMPEEPYLDELNARHIPPMLQLSSVRAPSSSAHPFLKTENHAWKPQGTQHHHLHRALIRLILIFLLTSLLHLVEQSDAPKLQKHSLRIETPGAPHRPFVVQMESSLARALAQNELANQLDDNILHQLSRPLVSMASYASRVFSSKALPAAAASAVSLARRKRNSVRVTPTNSTQFNSAKWSDSGPPESKSRVSFRMDDTEMLDDDASATSGVARSLFPAGGSMAGRSLGAFKSASSFFGSSFNDRAALKKAGQVRQRRQCVVKKRWQRPSRSGTVPAHLPIFFALTHTD